MQQLCNPLILSPLQNDQKDCVKKRVKKYIFNKNRAEKCRLFVLKYKHFCVGLHII